jgi:hypothetical protein
MPNAPNRRYIMGKNEFLSCDGGCWRCHWQLGTYKKAGPWHIRRISSTGIGAGAQGHYRVPSRHSCLIKPKETLLFTLLIVLKGQERSHDINLSQCFCRQPLLLSWCSSSSHSSCDFKPASHRHSLPGDACPRAEFGSYAGMRALG